MSVVYWVCLIYTEQFSATQRLLHYLNPTRYDRLVLEMLLIHAVPDALCRDIFQLLWQCVDEIIDVDKMRNGLSRLKLNELFTLDDNNRGTRGQSWKLAKFWCTRDCCIFSNRVIINRWNQLDQRAVGASSTSAFKGWLNKIRETRMGFFNPPNPRPPRCVFWLVMPHNMSN